MKALSGRPGFTRQGLPRLVLLALLALFLLPEAYRAGAQEGGESDTTAEAELGARPEWVRPSDSIGDAQVAETPEAPQEDWVPLFPEADLTPQQAADRTYFLILSTSPRAEDRLFVLQELERLVGAGVLDSSTPYAHEVLAAILLADQRRSIRPESTRSDASVRLRAMRMVAGVGGRGAELILRELLKHEEDSAVRSEAVRSVGRLRLALDDELAELLVHVIRKEIADGPTPRFVRSLYDTIYVLDEVGVGVIDRRLFEGLFDLVEHAPTQQLRGDGFALLKHLADR